MANSDVVKVNVEVLKETKEVLCALVDEHTPIIQKIGLASDKLLSSDAFTYFNSNTTAAANFAAIQSGLEKVNSYVETIYGAMVNAIDIYELGGTDVQSQLSAFLGSLEEIKDPFGN